MQGFRPGLLLPDFRIVHNQVTVQSNFAAMVPANPDRFGLYFWVNLTANYLIAPQGFPLSNNLTFGVVSSTLAPYKFDDYGPIVCGVWNSFNVGVAMVAGYTELVYQPKGGEPSVAKINKSAGKSSIQSLLSHWRSQ
jgi:hypothetical protein